MGLQGAAWAMVGSNLVMYVIRVVMAHPIVRIAVNWPLMLMNIVIVAAQACVMAWHPSEYLLISGVLFLLVCIVSTLDVYPFVKSLVNAISGKPLHKNGKHVGK